MDNKHPSAPELPGKHSGHYDIEPEEPETAEQAAPEQPKPQLIQSTKPAEAEESEDESLADDDEALLVDEADEDDELNEHVERPGDPDGVVAEEKIKEWQQTHPLPTTMQKPKHRLQKIIVALVVIAALTAAAWWIGNKKAEAPAAKQTSTTTQTQTPPAAQATTETTHYDSSIYTLGFDYPKDWKISDTSTKLTVTSPELSLTGSDGKSLKAHVVVTMQNQQTTVAGYPTGGAIAAIGSDKVTYKKPTQIQRAQTYLSYLGYTDQSSLDALFVTGDNGYQQGQTVPMSDVIKGNPLISVTFLNCSTADCTNGGSAVKLQASSWKSSQANKDITALLESLQFN